jgi:hypothetical protein
MNSKWISGLFVIAALYDGLLGIGFLFAPESIFLFYQVEPPNHWAYVQFPALLLIIFTIMFLRIAFDPAKHRELILYGCGLKISYAGMAFWYEVTMGIPSMWIPWAWADVAFLVLFLVAWASVGKSRTAIS